ncbi:MAG: hypothetical protein AABZ77_09495 [Chloroflexota bacterium]
MTNNAQGLDGWDKEDLRTKCYGRDVKTYRASGHITRPGKGLDGWD